MQSKLDVALVRFDPEQCSNGPDVWELYLERNTPGAGTMSDVQTRYDLNCAPPGKGKILCQKGMLGLLTLLPPGSIKCYSHLVKLLLLFILLPERKSHWDRNNTLFVATFEEAMAGGVIRLT